MRFVTYESPSGPARVGRLDGDTVLDVGFDGDMIAFIEAGAPIGAERPVPGARLLAPLVPRSFRDFLAFEGHLVNAYRNLGREVPAEWYEVPVYYRSMGTTVTGPDTVLPWPSYSRQLDHELELAAVIGRPCRDVRAEDALDFVFGFTIWNDMSARDVQRRELPVGMGPAKAKEWDGSNVLGPCIVTADEIADPQNLGMWLEVNGKRVQNGSTKTMIFGVAELVAYCSRFMTLFPGDLITTGTPPGVGLGMKPPKYLVAGDEMRLGIEGLGEQRQKVHAWDPALIDG